MARIEPHLARILKHSLGKSDAAPAAHELQRANEFLLRVAPD